jgi:RNA polymerase sigma factor (TIGR02999 family)
MVSGNEPTTLLVRWASGEQAALDCVVSLLYDEMHKIAARELRGERHAALQPTVLVNEVYLRLVQLREIRWQDRQHFLSMCARLTRRALVDEARKRNAAKRGSALEVTLVPEIDGEVTGGFSLIDIDDLLSQLEEFDPQAASVVELRVFAGLSIEEAASELDVSPSTVSRKWVLGRAWLTRQVAPARDDASR